MKKRILKLLLVSSLVIFLFSGCGNSIKESVDTMTNGEIYGDYDYGYKNEDLIHNAESKVENSSTSANNTNVSTNRKLIKRVSLDVETEEYDEFIKNLNNKINELGGYVESSKNYGNSIYYNSETRSAVYKIRVPQDKLDVFVVFIENGGNIVERQENVEDVTLTYTDVESKKNSLILERTRLQELLTKAENLSDIIQLEDKLSEVEYEIGRLESTLRTYDNLVDYSVINITIEEVERYTDVPSIQKTPFEKMGEGFIESLNDIKDGFVNFFVELVIAIPYFVLYGVVILLIVIFIKIIRKKFVSRKSINNNATPNQNITMYQNPYVKNDTFVNNSNMNENNLERTTSVEQEETLDDLFKKQ